MNGIEGVADALASDVRLEFASDVTPAFELGLDGATRADGQASPLWPLLRPRIIARSRSTGLELWRMAPYGDPNPPTPFVALAVTVGAAVLLYSLLRRGGAS